MKAQRMDAKLGRRVAIPRWWAPAAIKEEALDRRGRLQRPLGAVCFCALVYMFLGAPRVPFAVSIAAVALLILSVGFFSYLDLAGYLDFSERGTQPVGQERLPGFEVGSSGETTSAGYSDRNSSPTSRGAAQPPDPTSARTRS